MRTCFGDLSTADNEYPVGGTDCRKPVRNDEARAVFKYGLYCILNQHLGLGIDGACRLIEYKDTGVCKDDACKGDELLLPGR